MISITIIRLWELAVLCSLSIASVAMDTAESEAALERYEGRPPGNWRWKHALGSEYAVRDQRIRDADRLLLLLPELVNEPLVKKYTSSDTEWPTDVAKKFKVGKRRLAELNPQFKSIVGRGPCETFWVPNTPDDMGERQVFEGIPTLIRRGEPLALKWLTRWSSLQGQLGARKHPFSRCMEALHHVPELWPLAEGLPSAKDDQTAQLLLDCIAYVCSQGEVTPRMLASVELEYPSSSLTRTVLTCLALKRNSAFKQEILELLADTSRWKPHMSILAYGMLDYLSQVGDASDIPSLETIAGALVDEQAGRSMKSYGYMRRDIESCIRSTKIQITLWP